MPIPVSEEIKQALQAPVKQLRSTITWVGNDMTEHTITSEDRIVSIKKEAEGYYLASALRKITIVTTGTAMDLLDQAVKVNIQVKLQNSTWGTIPWGTFQITEAKASENKENVTFTGYGGVNRLQERTYVGGELTFPTTVAGLISEFAETTGLELGPETHMEVKGYTRLEYIENPSDAYITTDYKPTSKTKVEATIQPLSVPVDTTYTETGVFGMWQSGKVYRVFWGNAATHKWYWSQGTGGQDVQLIKQKIIFDPYGGTTVVNGTTYTYTPTIGDWESTVNFKIFRADVSSNHYSANMRVFDFTIYQNGEIVRQLYPAKRHSDGKIGLYDIVTDTFYTTSSSTEFTAGPEISSLPNASAPIAEDLWANITGTTYRDILEEIAGATGTLAVIGGGDDTLDLNPMPIAAPTDTMTDANLVNFKIGPKWGPADAVVLSRQPQGDNVELADQEYIDAQAGYNWIEYSDTFRTGSVANGITPTILEDGSLQVVCAQGNGNWHTGWWDALNGNSNGGAGTCLGRWLSNIRAGDQFTISFTIKKLPGATGTPKVYVNNSLSYQTMTGTIGTEYSEVYNTRTWAGTNIPIHIGWGDCTGTFIIKNWQLKKGSYAPYEPYKTNGRTDIVIANNEILDDQRETAIIPLLTATEGLQYRDATYKTEGHGYHEIGDRIDVTISGQTYPTIVTKSVIIVDGGINETLTSTTPEAIAIDYAKAGGITKTIFNTELAVDKQHQEIEAIVSRQDQTDETISENYTRLLQTINNIQATVQVSGGGNLIKNSVGFGKQSDGTLTIWQYGAGASTTTVKSQSSTASLNAGAISGHEINITGATSTTISQDVQLTPGELYNLSFRIQKSAVGSATVSITDGITTQTIAAQDQVAYTWNQLDADFTPANGSVTVTITANNCTAAITDLMLAQGGRTGWRQASGEIYNLQVSVDQDGVQVKSATYAGDYTAITPLEFAGYSNASGIMKKVFTINRDVTEVEKLYAKSQIKMPPMEIVPIDNVNYKGWAFVQTAD